MKPETPFRSRLLREVFACLRIALLLVTPVIAGAQTIYDSSDQASIYTISSTGTVGLFAHLYPNPPYSSFGSGIAIDGSGNIYDVDRVSGQISKITPSGTVSLFATLFSGTNGYSSYSYAGLAFDNSGNLYASDATVHQISKITPNGTVSIFATLPTLDLIQGLAFDNSGNLYAAENNFSQILKITPSGVESVFATLKVGSPGNAPSGLADLVFDGSSNFYSTDFETGNIDKISLTGSVSLFATLPANTGALGLTMDSSGDLYVAGFTAHDIEKITPDGTVSTLATGVYSAYLAASPAPIPEPSTWAMLALGIPALLASRRFFGRPS